jgi:PAS domain S-box-containing protein
MSYLDTKSDFISNPLYFLVKLLDLSHEAIFAWELDGPIIYWNKGAEKKYGFTTDEAVGRTSHSLLLTKHPMRFDEFISVLKGDGYWEGEIEHTTKDNRTLIIESRQQVIIDDAGRSIVLETNRDITERKQSEIRAAKAKALADKQTRQLNIILENIFEGVLIVDRNGDIIHINKSGLKMHGLQSCNFNDFREFRNNYEILSLEGNPVKLEDLPIERALRGEFFTNYELILRRKDSGSEWVGSYNGIPVYDEYGELNIAIITLRDITEHIKHLELIFKAEAEKDKREVLEKAIEVKDEFLSLVSHEFKTPITVINSTLQVMDHVCKDELSNRAKNYLKKIHQNSMRQLRLVNNIMELTKLNGGHNQIKKQRIDIVFLTKAIIESVILYAQQKNITVTFICSANKRIVCIDDEKYERILLNLLSNAIKYSPEGKSITVTLKFTKQGLGLTVKDEGIGIPSDKTDFIFEKFGRVDSAMTRQTEGTGIGLSLVRLLVESLGGSIKVNSTIGIGSTFIIKIPIFYNQDEESCTYHQEMVNNRIIQTTAIEFSDIYL